MDTKYAYHFHATDNFTGDTIDGVYTTHELVLDIEAYNRAKDFIAKSFDVKRDRLSLSSFTLLGSEPDMAALKDCPNLERSPIEEWNTWRTSSEELSELAKSIKEPGE
jgi:hypothetical protein